jgi:hypothetical protein
MRVMKIKRKKINPKKNSAKKTLDKPKPKKPSNPKNPTNKTKKSAAKKTAKGKPGPKREMNKETGFSVGSDQDIIAMELLKGGSSRSEVAERAKKLLPATTKKGTAKPISNLVSAVFNKLVRQGYRVEESFKVLPPTPASKRKATMAAKGK